MSQTDSVIRKHRNGAGKAVKKQKDFLIPDYVSEDSSSDEEEECPSTPSWQPRSNEDDENEEDGDYIKPALTPAYQPGSDAEEDSSDDEEKPYVNPVWISATHGQPTSPSYSPPPGAFYKLSKKVEEIDSDPESYTYKMDDCTSKEPFEHSDIQVVLIISVDSIKSHTFGVINFPNGTLSKELHNVLINTPTLIDFSAEKKKTTIDKHPIFCEWIFGECNDNTVHFPELKGHKLNLFSRCPGIFKVSISHAFNLRNKNFFFHMFR